MQYKNYMWWSVCILSVGALQGASEATVEDVQKQLGQAIRMGDESAVRELLSQGAEAGGGAIGRFSTPLIEAIRAGNTAILDLLVEHGADIEKGNSEENTALMHAVDAKNLPMIQRLLELGADAEVGSGYLGLTPVVAAAMRKDEGIVKLLARHGARQPTEQELERLPDSFMIPTVKRFLSRQDIRRAFRKREKAAAQFLQEQERVYCVPRDVTRVVGEFGGISPQGLEERLPTEHGSLQPE